MQIYACIELYILFEHIFSNVIYFLFPGFVTNKSPGCDGLTAEFYQTFFGVIGSDLVDVINYAFENEKLTLNMRRGIIVLIWKDNEREYYNKLAPDFLT